MRQEQQRRAGFAHMNHARHNRDQERKVNHRDAHKHVTSQCHPILILLHRHHCHPCPRRNRARADDDINREERLVVLKSREHAVRLRHQARQENYAVAQKQIPTQSRLRRRDGDLDAHRRDNQCHVIGEADSEQKHRPVEITHLVRRINPSQQTSKHAHERKQAEGINLHNHRLTPHEAVKSDQHSRHITGQHAQGVFVATINGFELLDPFEDHAAATRGNQRNQPARQGASHRGSQRHAPGDVRDRRQHGEQPGKQRPNGVAGRMRHAGVKGAGG